MDKEMIFFGTHSEKAKSYFEKLYFEIESLQSNYHNNNEFNVLRKSVLVLERAFQDIDEFVVDKELLQELKSKSTELLYYFTTFLKQVPIDLIFAYTYHFLAFRKLMMSDVKNVIELEIMYLLFVPNSLDFAISNSILTNKGKERHKSYSGSFLASKRIKNIIHEWEYYKHSPSINKFRISEKTKQEKIRKQYLLDKIKINFEYKIYGDLFLDKLENLTIDEYLKTYDKQTSVEFKKAYKKIIETTSFQFNIPDLNEYIFNHKDTSKIIFLWTIDIKIQDENVSAADVGFLIWTISEALQKIDGVKVEIEGIYKGSLLVKLKVWIRDLLSKEEVKEVTDKTRKALEARYLDKHIEDVGFTKAQKLKVEKESDNLLSKDQFDRKFELELLEKQLHIDQMKIDNKLKELELIKGITHLMEEGIIKVNSDLQIIINSEIYLTKTEKGIEIGSDINLIDEKAESINLGKDEEKELKGNE